MSWFCCPLAAATEAARRARDRTDTMVRVVLPFLPGFPHSRRPALSCYLLLAAYLWYASYNLLPTYGTAPVLHPLAIVSARSASAAPRHPPQSHSRLRYLDMSQCFKFIALRCLFLTQTREWSRWIHTLLLLPTGVALDS